MYGEWTARQTTTLFESPGSSVVVGSAREGEALDAPTGQVHLQPTPVLVRYAEPEHFSAEVGTIVFLLDYLGEGHGKVWVNGQVETGNLSGVQEHCAIAGPDCWGEVIDPADAGRMQNGTWWFQIQASDGTVGWTRESSHFTGAYGCG